MQVAYLCCLRWMSMLSRQAVAVIKCPLTVPEPPCGISPRTCACMLCTDSPRTCRCLLEGFLDKPQRTSSRSLHVLWAKSTQSRWQGTLGAKARTKGMVAVPFIRCEAIVARQLHDFWSLVLMMPAYKSGFILIHRQHIVCYMLLCLDRDVCLLTCPGRPSDDCTL